MSKEGNFLVYCTEQYKSAKGLTGKQVSVEDIDLYIEARQQAMA